AGAVPAALLDAAHRDPGLRAGGEEDRDVGDPVVRGAEALLAFVEEDRAIARVLDGEVVDRCPALELGDRDLAVGRRERGGVEGGGGPVEGVDGEGSGRGGLADTDRLGEVIGEGRRDVGKGVHGTYVA